MYMNNIFINYISQIWHIHFPALNSNQNLHAIPLILNCICLISKIDSLMKQRKNNRMTFDVYTIASLSSFCVFYSLDRHSKQSKISG